MIAQAFILGAGLGMRLRPLTEDLPKPLIPVFQKPLITFVLDHLIAAGMQSFVVNTHHRSEVLREFFAGGSWVPVDISEAWKNPKLADYYFGHNPANRFAG